jgi:hypothetical protein
VLGDTRKRTSADASLTEVSPVKGVQPTPDVPRLEWKDTGVIVESPENMKDAAKKLDFDGEQGSKEYVPREGTPPPPPSAREKKRPKKHSKANTTAGSSEERRLAQ